MDQSGSWLADVASLALASEEDRPWFCPYVFVSEDTRKLNDAELLIVVGFENIRPGSPSHCSSFFSH